MRQYKYIPFPELRRQYRRRQRVRKELVGLAVKIIVSASCGLITGLMLAGLWIEF